MSGSTLINHILNNRYRIIRPLSMGGMGQTYIAEDIQRPNNPVCVVKQLRPASNDPSFLGTARRLFNNEAVSLEKLGRMNNQIPQLLAYFEHDEEFYLVQDFVDGHPLSAEMELGERWSEPEVCQLLYDILTILECVHREGLIHRDIKPDNIIRRKDRKLCLIDFGAVKQIRIHRSEQSKVNSRTIGIGTLGYMPTEQAAGKPRPSSDLYALGIVAIQALTGMLPTQMKGARNGDLIWRDQAEVSESLGNFLDVMVSYRFEERFATATEALHELKYVLSLKQETAEFRQTARRSGHRANPQERNQYPQTEQKTQNVCGTLEDEPPQKSNNRPAKVNAVQLGIGSVLVTLGLVAGSAYWYSRSQQSQMLESLNTLYTDKQYNSCIAQAQSFPSFYADLYGKAQENAQKCKVASEQEGTLKQIQQLVKTGNADDFEKAVQLYSNGGLENSSFYKEAQAFMSQSSELILEVAEKKYLLERESGYQQAIKIAEAIPKNSSAYSKARKLLQQWKEEEARNQADYAQAKKALAEKQFNDAHNFAIKLSTSPVEAWKQLSQTIQNEVDTSEKQAKLAAAKSAEGLSQQEALSIINRWLEARSSIFGPPFDQQLVVCQG